MLFNTGLITVVNAMLTKPIYSSTFIDPPPEDEKQEDITSKRKLSWLPSVTARKGA